MTDAIIAAEMGMAVQKVMDGDWRRGSGAAAGNVGGHGRRAADRADGIEEQTDGGRGGECMVECGFVAVEKGDVLAVANFEGGGGVDHSNPHGFREGQSAGLRIIAIAPNEGAGKRGELLQYGDPAHIAAVIERLYAPFPKGFNRLSGHAGIAVTVSQDSDFHGAGNSFVK